MSRAEETERYRNAAEQTLRQLEWCIAYFRSLRKTEIADVIDRNRKFIKDRMSQSDR
jgi:hypothetical protein